MKLTGLTAQQVDEHVDNFAKLMMAGMHKVCKSAASHIKSFGLTADGASDGDVSFAVDALGVMTAQWDTFVDESLMPVLTNMAIDAGKVLASPLGNVHVADKKTEDYLHHMQGWVTELAGDMWQTAKTAIITGAQDGESIGELATRVEQVAQVKAKKAHTIAQTAVIAAINGGEWQQMMEFASHFETKGTKEWIATHDTHTRPSHHEADGQVVPLDSHFTVGGEFLMFPGDPSATAGEVANCRCTVAYELAAEDQITASQTSLETLSGSPAVATNGQISVADGTMLLETLPLTAAVNAEFNAMHPRGKDGKFIEKGHGLPVNVFDVLVKAKHDLKWDDLGHNQKQDFVHSATQISHAQWDNLKDEDQKHIKDMVNDALDAGTPGASKAALHLESLHGGHDEEGDVFNPNVHLPSTPVKKVTHAAKKVAAKKVAPAHDLSHNEVNLLLFDAEETGGITKKQKLFLLDHLHKGKSPNAVAAALKTMIKDNEKKKKNESGVNLPPVSAEKKAAEKAIYDAHDAGHIDEQQQQFALDVLDNDGVPAAEAYLAQHVPTASAPLTTGSATPIKITHGIIHAKHVPGTVIAKNDDGDTITWNGASYDIKDANGDIVTGDIKKSKLYAHLGTHFGQSQWFGSGKQETEVSHANPLDAAPPAAPIPHPVGGKGQSSGSSTGWPSTPGLVNDNTDPFGTSSDDVKTKVTAAFFSNKIDEAQFNELVGHINNATMSPENVEKQLHAYVNGEPSPVTPNVGAPDMWDTTGLSPAKAAEMNKLSYAYNKGLMTTEEAHQQIDLLKKGPEPGDLVTPSVPSEGSIAPGTPLLHEDIADIFNAANDGDVLAVGATLGGTPYELSKMSSTQVSAKNTTNGVESSMTLDQLQNATASNKIAWQKPGGPSAPTPAAPTPVTPPVVSVHDIPAVKKQQFYTHFKTEKVSPAWSGAKIYASMHAAKAKMAGDPQIAAMNDEQMLKMLDLVESGKKATFNTNAYENKVKEWLKTPNGQKAFKQLNPAIASNPVSTPLPSVAKKLAKKVSPSSGLSVDEALGDSSIDAFIDTGTLYTSFKGASYGKYLNDKPEQIYWNAVQQSKAAAHTTPGSILAVIDAESAKKFGVTNEHKFTEKVKTWLATPSGKKKAAEIQAGTWSPGISSSSSSYGSSGFGTSYSHPADTPLNDKIPPVQQVPDFDASKGYSWTDKHHGDFPVLTDGKAKAMVAKWDAEQGVMTAGQKSALKKYTGSSYTPMNDYLRGYSGASDQTHKDVQNAQKGMRLSTEPLVLHRGNGWFKGWGNVAEVKSHLGEDFHQEAFFSTSIGGKSAFSGAINFVIECPPGTPMSYVKTFSHFNSENEMLLGGNLTYKVVEVIEGSNAPDGSGHYNTKVTVRLRVVPPSITANDVDVDTTAA